MRRHNQGEKWNQHSQEKAQHAGLDRSPRADSRSIAPPVPLLPTKCLDGKDSEVRSSDAELRLAALPEPPPARGFAERGIADNRPPILDRGSALLAGCSTSLKLAHNEPREQGQGIERLHSERFALTLWKWAC